MCVLRAQRGVAPPLPALPQRYDTGDSREADGRHKSVTRPFQVLPDKFFSHIGRGAVVADLGGVSMMLRMVVHVLGYNLMAFATAVTAPLMPDYQNNVAKASKKES